MNCQIEIYTYKVHYTFTDDLLYACFVSEYFSAIQNQTLDSKISV